MILFVLYNHTFLKTHVWIRFSSSYYLINVRGLGKENEGWSKSKSGNVGKDVTDKTVSKCLCSDKHQQGGPQPGVKEEDGLCSGDKSV